MRSNLNVVKNLFIALTLCWVTHYVDLHDLSSSLSALSMAQASVAKVVSNRDGSSWIIYPIYVPATENGAGQCPTELIH